MEIAKQTGYTVKELLSMDCQSFDRLLMAVTWPVADGSEESSLRQRNAQTKPNVAKTTAINRRGRLPGIESAAKNAAALVLLRRHSTMVDFPDELAAKIGVSSSTACRWIVDFRDQNRNRE